MKGRSVVIEVSTDALDGIRTAADCVRAAAVVLNAGDVA